MLTPFLGGFTFEPIAAAIQADGTLDLDDPNAILQIIKNISLDQSDLEAVADIIAASNAAIDADAADATGFSDLVAYTLAAQSLAQEDETQALRNAYSAEENQYDQEWDIANTPDFQALEQTYTGADLQAAIVNALPRFSLIANLGADDTAPTDAATVHFTLTFGDAVSNVIASDFTVTASSGLSGVRITGISPIAGSNGTSWDIAVASGVGQGTIALNYSPSDPRNSYGLPISDGTFAAPQFIQDSNLSDRGAPAFVLGDFNGDGKPDILVLAQQDGIPAAVDMYLNEGGGNFQALAPVAAGYGDDGAIAIGDFNGDGKLDAVTTDIGANTVAVLLGNGDGTFQQQIDTPTGNGPDSISVGDFDGDGKLDIAVGNENDNTISILLGNGDGTFRVGPTLSSQDVWQLATADLNGDGKVDLLAVNYGAGTVSVFLGNGDGTFTAAAALGIGRPDVTCVAVGDLNGDGISDLVVGSNYGNTGPNLISVFLGNGNGTFTPGASYEVDPNYNGQVLSLAIGDVNNDTHPDIVVGDSLGTVIFLGNSNGTFTAGTSLSDAPITDNVQQFALGDLNGDDRLDLVTGNGWEGSNIVGGPGGIEILYNAAPAKLDSTSDPVTIDRPQAAAPVLTQTAGTGTLTQNGNTYTLDLGLVPKGQALSALQFALSNLASAPADSFDGSFGIPAGAGFTVTGATLPDALAPGQSYDGLNLGIDVNTVGQHTETLTFAPRDLEVTQAGEVDISGSDEDQSSTTDSIAATVAAELPAITLVVEDDVEPCFAPASAADNTDTFVTSGNIVAEQVVSSGVNLDVLAGATTTGVTVGGSALELIYGVASTTTVIEGGGDYVESGGVGVSANLAMCALETVLGGGFASGTTASQAEQLVYGSVLDTTLTSGSEQFLAGGSATSTELDDSVQVVGLDQSGSGGSGGMAFLTWVYGGGYQFVASGGAADGVEFDPGGYGYVASGGKLYDAYDYGGTNLVVGTAIETNVGDGGMELVLAGGSSVYPTVGTDGVEYDAGTVEDINVEYGYAYVASGGIINGADFETATATSRPAARSAVPRWMAATTSWPDWP
jgi:hypothetical protein